MIIGEKSPAELNKVIYISAIQSVATLPMCHCIDHFNAPLNHTTTPALYIDICPLVCALVTKISTKSDKFLSKNPVFHHFLFTLKSSIIEMKRLYYTSFRQRIHNTMRSITIVYSDNQLVHETIRLKFFHKQMKTSREEL